MIIGSHHFTVAGLVAWPLRKSEAWGDIVLLKPPYFSYVYDTDFMLISSNLHEKSS